MKIYGHFMSPPANQVRLTAAALGLEHDYQHVDIPGGETRTPEYHAVNPFGRVPALEDDGFKLAESGAISRYLADKAESPLYPQDRRKRAEIDQWMDVASHHIRANTAKVLFNKVFAPMMEMEADQKAMAEGREFLTNNLTLVNETLGRNAYLTGDALTIADTAMMAATEPFELIEFDVSPFANVEKWRKTIMSQDWYQNVHAHYAAEMQG